MKIFPIITHIVSNEFLCFLWQTVEVAFCNWNMTKMRHNHFMYIVEWYVRLLIEEFCHFSWNPHTPQHKQSRSIYILST